MLDDGKLVSMQIIGGAFEIDNCDSCVFYCESCSLNCAMQLIALLRLINLKIFVI